MFKLFKNLRKKDIAILLVAVILIVMQVWLEIKIPDYMSSITTLVETEGSQMSEILKNGAYMIICALTSFALAILVGYLVSNLSAAFSMRVRKKLFTKVENLGLYEVKQFSTSSLITRTTNDITQLQMLLAMGTQMIIKAPITAIWAISKIVTKSASWSIATAVAVLILLATIGIITILVLPKFKIVQKLTDKLNSVTRENLTGIRVVRAFNAENYQEEKFEKVNDKLTSTQLFNHSAFAFFDPVMYLIMNLLTLAIYIIGTNLIINASLMDKVEIFGNMVVFISYAMQVIGSFLSLAFIFMMYPRAEISANRINEVLDMKESIKDGNFGRDSKDKKLKEKKKKKKGTVEFKNVYFKYEDAESNLLEDINFKVNKGETVAFIGSTGSGKSTLINLIPRFYDVTKGNILVDGIDVKNYTQEYLHDKIGYISQSAVIFNDTLKNNIAFGDNGREKIDENKVEKSIEVAQAKDFVEKMEDSYDTMMSRGGTNVSGGQKQRLSIARAIARDPEIYIFDDTFSALDYKTDSNLRKALKNYTKNATILIVAQRVGTIMNADKIVVLDNGKVVGMGKHKDLLKNCEVYKEIALSQLTEKELEG